MAFNFTSIKINSIDYFPTSPIEMVDVNTAAIQAFLNSLNLGVFTVQMNGTTFLINIIQTSNTVQSFTTDEPATHNFDASNCLSLEVDPEVVCDYEIQALADPSDVLMAIVVGTVEYIPVDAIPATDATTAQNWLDSQGLGFIQWNYQSSLYIIATLSYQNLSYIKILRNGTDIIFIPFVQSNCHLPILGCMNPLADNYNPDAEIENNTCLFGTLTYGCKDPDALNYNPDANVADDSCLYTFSVIEKLRCCAGDMGAKIAINDNIGAKQSCCALKKLAYVNDLIKILETYHPDAENFEIITTPAVAGYIVIDLNSFALFGNLFGYITVGGVIIGVLPMDNYGSLSQLITALVMGIDFGYAAVDNGDGTITITDTNPPAVVNGSIVIIQINPQFLGSADLITGWNYYEGIYIDSPGSIFHEKVVIAARELTLGTNALRVFDNGIEIPGSPIYFPVYGFPATILINVLAYDPITDRVYTTGYSSASKYSYVDGALNVGLTSTWGANLAAYLLAGGISFMDLVYNPFDQNKYTVGGRTAETTISRIETANNDLVTSAFNVFPPDVENFPFLIINPANGNLWIAYGTNVFIVDQSTLTLLVTTPIPGASHRLTDITYYPGDGTASSERMFISVYIAGVGNSFIASLNMDGTIDNVAFHNMTSNSFNTKVFYSPQFNVLFVKGLVLDIVKMDGVLYQGGIVIPNRTTAANFIEDTKNRKTHLSIYDGSFNTAYITIELADDGTEITSGVIEGAEPEITENVQVRPNDNCRTVEEIDSMIAFGLELCSKCCGDTDEQTANDII